ncbi:hydroxymethylpyrimidine ABC transporter [Halalkalibacter wakoensis JCM 9140]|uniref:Hydroxymethylpyrimidine ABC transporter n=1 Tax=Halalkalibacter wakoensis JCM 9140 TaxID=1236970 RepID=W4Q0I7_9BACI|nr:ABC transporter permease [Halalkalibacter wakoensis]GAE25591.1 hydroxymethylpyrimidine ABC transporter [Halalkalibacter wakoensis JCM 9140]
MRTLRRGISFAAPAVIAVILFLVIWEVSVWIWNVEEWILPAPSLIFQAFFDTWHLLPDHIWMTTKEAVLGFLLGIIVALIIAFILDISPLLRKSFYPILLFSQTIPIIAIAPLLIIWFGYGILPKVLVVALVTFFPVVVSVAEGLQSSDRDMIRLVRSMGGSFWQVFWSVRFPHALPYLFTGLRIGATYSVLAAVISEWVGASKGLGIYLIKAQSSFATDKVFVVIALISLLSCLLFFVVVLLGRLMMPWKHKSHKK